MNSRNYCSLILMLFISINLLGGGLQNKKVSKTSVAKSGMTIPSLKSTGIKSLSNIDKNLNTMMDRFGIKSQFQNTSSASAKSTISFPQRKLNLPEPSTIGENIHKIYWNSGSGTPRYIETTISPNPKIKSVQSVQELLTRAKEFMVKNKSILKIQDPLNEFTFKYSQTDKLNITHMKFLQTYHGIELWAKELIVHMDNKGNVISAGGIYEPTPVMLTDLNGRLNESDAIEKSLNDLQSRSRMSGIPSQLSTILDYNGPTAKKIIWHDNNHFPRLAWFVEIRSNLSNDWYYFIDAVTGEILNSYNNVCYDGITTGTGVDLNGVTRTFGTYQLGSDYFLSDASQPMYNAAQSKIPDDMMGAIVGLDLRNQNLDSKSTIYFITTQNNQWTDPAAVSAHYNAIVTYKYFLNSHSRNSIDDKGMTIYSTVHVTEEGQSMENAFWSGKIMCYGDGGTYFKPLAGGLDVAAHEMTHGVTQYSANLEYQNQSGALNESMSDVFGALVDTLNWQMGEMIIKNINTFPSGAMRDLSDPHNGANTGTNAWQPSNMSEFVNTTKDNGGVHINSGIPNRAFYLVATNIGRAKAGQIWYRALNFYLTRSSQFVDARIATEKAATDIFGENSNEVTSVKNAWDAVGVVQGDPTKTPPTSTLIGDEWILVTNTDPNDPNSIYMVKTTVNSSSDYFPLTTTKVMNRPAVSDATGLIIFVDGDNNLRAIMANPDNPQETVLDDQGIWNSVAIGPGLISLALTSIYQDTTIYYLDLVNNTSQAFKIATQAYDAADVKTALYADALSFEATGRYLIFDTYNEVNNSSGSKFDFWNINILDVQLGKMSSVFPPLSEGINVGNPSYSKTSSTRFTFDLIDVNKNQDFVYAADFNTGEVAAVAGPLYVLGYPTYSPDDKTIAYHTIELVSGTEHESIEQMPLKENMLEGTGAANKYVYDCTFPFWFVIGSRVTDVEDSKESLPTTCTLNQNYPNPFNPETIISYQLAQSAMNQNGLSDFMHVELKVFDVLGREIITLVDKEQRTGNYVVKFDGTNLSSGIYFYRIQAGNFIKMQKMVLMK